MKAAPPSPRPSRATPTHPPAPPPLPTGARIAAVDRHTTHGVRHQPDALVLEEPLEIRIRGRGVAVIMRTPGHDEDLAAGFLLSEGIVRAPSDIVEIAPCTRTNPDAEGNVLNVFLRPSVHVDWQRLSRHVFAGSSCGLCGKTTIDAIHTSAPPLPAKPNFRIRSTLLLQLPTRLRSAQPLFDCTGAVHAAALFSARGRLLALREDIGRHNAVDKLLGFALRNGLLPLNRHLLLVSGRVSFEIVQKALVARVPFIAGVSGPSHLALDFAQASHQTLVGFLRPNSFNLYTHPHRLTP